MQQSQAIPRVERVTFFADSRPVTTVFSSKTLGRDRLVEHIQAADLDTAVQVRTVGAREYANVYTQGGTKRVLAPIAPSPRAKRPRRQSERRRWELENGPCVTIRPRAS